MGSRLHNSPLGAELDAARAEATDDVVAHATRRRPVLVTRLPGDEREQAFRRAIAEMCSLSDLEVGDGE